MTDHLIPTPLPRYAELPAIELYLDQVLRVVNDAVRPYVFSEKDAPLTGTMVNNYVKHDVLPAPHKKLYAREHLAKLIVITIMKSVFSIPEIKQFLTCAPQDAFGAFYDRFCTELGIVSRCLFGHDSAEMPQNEDDAFLRIMVSAAVGKLYVQKKLQTVEHA